MKNVQFVQILYLTIYKYQDIKIINQINKSDKSFYCPIMLGVSFLDQIKKLETLKKCSFQGIAYPILLLPFLSRCSEIIGKKIFLEFEENKFLLNFNLSISSNYFQQELPFKSNNTENIFLENKIKEIKVKKIKLSNYLRINNIKVKCI